MRAGDTHEGAVMRLGETGVKQTGLPFCGAGGLNDDRDERGGFRGDRLVTQCAANWGSCRFFARCVKNGVSLLLGLKLATHCVANSPAIQFRVAQKELAAELQ